MRQIQMTNEDGTPFYANLNADLPVAITLSEAYTLVDSLKSTLAFNLDLMSKGNLPADMVAMFNDMEIRLSGRISALEAVIDNAKYEQWAAVAPAWAIRAR